MNPPPCWTAGDACFFSNTFSIINCILMLFLGAMFLLEGSQLDFNQLTNREKSPRSCKLSLMQMKSDVMVCDLLFIPAYIFSCQFFNAHIGRHESYTGAKRASQCRQRSRCVQERLDLFNLQSPLWWGTWLPCCVILLQSSSWKKQLPLCSSPK